MDHQLSPRATVCLATGLPGFGLGVGVGVDVFPGMVSTSPTYIWPDADLPFACASVL